SYGQIFSVMPFGNGVVTKTLTGAQLKALLELQFRASTYAPGFRPALLVPSASLNYSYALSRPIGNRVTRIQLNGKPIVATRRYRVATIDYLASGGDGYSVFADGRDAVEAGTDLDATAAWIAKGQAVPAVGRTRNLAN
ncbi:MAG: 5'-nucleotidase C-terminal domain-containing protein, partial [Pseudomonadota bacterium]|nr:5'-nucleotidase C-terminal domain-containing protein [Pseudomonadota bacterium]